MIKHSKKAIAIMLSVLTVASATSMSTIVNATDGNKNIVTEATQQSVSNDETKATYENWEYVYYSDGTAYIAGYSGSETELTIPSELEGHKVVGVGYQAFCGNDKITKITISDGVENVVDGAFMNCKNLKEVSLPESLTNLGREAFMYCENLVSVNIPDSITRINTATFENCKSLSKITLPDNLTYIGAEAFMNCENIADVKLPSKLLSINGAAFADCKKITAIDLPDSLNYIGSFAFANTSITRAVIPENVTELGGSIFAGIKDFTTLEIGKNVKFITGEALATSDSFVIKGYCDTPAYNTAFENDNKFISLGNAVGTEKAVVSSGDYKYTVYENNEVTIVDYVGTAEEVTFPSTIDGKKVVAIGDGTTFTNYNITKVNIPDGITDIGDFAFSGCSKLAYVTLPQTLLSIGKGSFRSTLLNTVEIPDSVENIGEQSFALNTRLTNVKIGKGIKSIGDKAFNNNAGMTITGHGDTVASTFAKDNGIKFVDLDAKAPSLSKTSVALQAGKTSNITVENAGSEKVSYITSNSKVATVSAKGVVTALSKGTAKITVTVGSTKLTYTVKVTSNPKLSKSTVTVNKGKTASVKITGKAKGVNNVYTNTKYAKVTSTKSATTLKIKGLKKGTTTLKIKVNGVALKLKVNVKTRVK